MLAAPQNCALTLVLVLSLFITSSGATASLKEGDQVSVEQSVGEWYSVVVADGQNGYVLKNRLKLAADVTPQPTLPQPAPAKNNSTEAKESAQDATPIAAPAPAAQPTPTKDPPKPPPAGAPVLRVEAPKVPEAKSQSILQMLEGHETEVKLGLIIAAIAFVLGWLCGAGYHARRERKSRHKLRF